MTDAIAIKLNRLIANRIEEINSKKLAMGRLPALTGGGEDAVEDAVGDAVEFDSMVIIS